MELLFVAWRQSSHWTGPGWGCCTLLGANPVTGLGLAWLFYAAWPQSSHWTGPGWGSSMLLSAIPVTGLGLDGAVVRCLAPIQSLDWAWMELLFVAWRQSSHWT